MRIPSDSGSYGDWLRNLPLKEKGAKVHLYNGREKRRSDVHYRIIDIDVGRSDLQQCADAVIRMRAEYLYSQNRLDEISFKFTSGDEVTYSAWLNGMRPNVEGNEVTFKTTSTIDSSYSGFKYYLKTIFNYAGTYSLAKELKPVRDPRNLKIGDVLIQGGFPGHAVFVVDIAHDTTTGNIAFLLAQGFTPAQDIHIMNNPTDEKNSPWYILDPLARIITPEWEFVWTDLKRFK